MRLHIILTAILVIPRLVGAQSPAERAMLAAWQDSLEALASVEDLPRYDSLSRLGPRGDARDIRRELFHVVSATLRADRPTLELALQNLDWTRSRKRGWPWPDFAMARAFVAMALLRMPVANSAGEYFDEAHADATWRHLAAALRIDPDFEAGRRYLWQLLLAGGERELRPDQLKPLQAEIARANPDADALTVWGRHLRRQADLRGALDAFQRAIASGGDPSRLALELARTRRALGDTTQARLEYWDGLAHLTPKGREAYRNDLAWMLDPDSLATFDRVPDDSLAAWLRRFWEERDAWSANVPGERLQEQLRRWVYVFGRYADLGAWKRTMFTRVDMSFESGLGGPPCVRSVPDFFKHLWRLQPAMAFDIRDREPVVDQRGLMYLRHGEPILRLADGQPMPSDTALWLGGSDPFREREVEANEAVRPRVGGVEAWLYLIGGEYRLLGFSGSTSMGAYAPTTLGSYLSYHPALWVAMAPFSSVYHESAAYMLSKRPDFFLVTSAMGGKVDTRSCSPKFQTVLAKARDDSRIASGVESDSPPILHPWPSLTRMFALGHAEDGTGEALLGVGISGGALEPADGADGGLIYPVQFRIVAYNRATGATVTIDTSRTIRSGAPLTGAQIVTVWTDVPLPAGDWAVALTARQDDPKQGVFAQVADLRVDGSPAITLSDIITGRPGQPDWIAPDGMPFPALLSERWQPGAEVAMYFQVHNVPAGEEYRTSIEVSSGRPNAKPLVRIAFTDRSAGSTTHMRKSLGLTQLKPGRYQLSVRVEAGGVRATRSQWITVEDPGP
jgi:hypothetical protein